MRPQHLFVGILVMIPSVPVLADAEKAVEKALLPPGYAMEVFAEGLIRPRSVDVSDDGHVVVGTNAMEIYVYVNANGDLSEFEKFLLPSFNNPNGVAWDGDDLYVAETTRVLLLRDPVAKLLNSERIEAHLVLDGLINSTHHGRRFIDIGPDGRLYLALGTPCNICLPPDPELSATIRAYNLDTLFGKTYARGLRNSVGFDWHPMSGELWATDNGRDWMGDDLPHDELNRVHTEGLHFGFPYCHQGDLPDPEYGDERPCSDFEPDAIGLGPHVAALGLHFITDGSSLPEGTALVALHGSWNRSERIGYAVNLLRFSDDASEVTAYEPFISGWLDDWGNVYARPVDVAQLPDGSLLVSDDLNGAVYRVSH